jgi:hypothetical protein
MVLHEFMNLTPAESLMILDPDKTQAKKMIKLTFADLLLTGVIRARVQEESNCCLQKESLQKEITWRPGLGAILVEPKLTSPYAAQTCCY